jgi:hypothetical protein
VDTARQRHLERQFSDHGQGTVKRLASLSAIRRWRRTIADSDVTQTQILGSRKIGKNVILARASHCANP